MPMHDWTRVDDGTYHDFHTGWIAELRKVLNRGTLPKGYYALAEQQAGDYGPDVLTLRRPRAGETGPGTARRPGASRSPPTRRASSLRPRPT